MLVLSSRSVAGNSTNDDRQVGYFFISSVSCARLRFYRECRSKGDASSSIRTTRRQGSLVTASGENVVGSSNEGTLGKIAN